MLIPVSQGPLKEPPLRIVDYKSLLKWLFFRIDHLFDGRLGRVKLHEITKVEVCFSWGSTRWLIKSIGLVPGGSSQDLQEIRIIPIIPIWKGTHNPILRGRKPTINHLLIGMILQIYYILKSSPHVGESARGPMDPSWVKQNFGPQWDVGRGYWRSTRADQFIVAIVYSPIQSFLFQMRLVVGGKACNSTAAWTLKFFFFLGGDVDIQFNNS